MPLSRAYGIDTALIKGEALVINHCTSEFAFMEKLLPPSFLAAPYPSSMGDRISKGNKHQHEEHQTIRK